MTATAYLHIEQDETGKLFTVGSHHKVIILLTDHVAWKSTAEDLAAGYPDLGLAAAHCILAYFYDNEAAVRAEIDRRDKEVTEFFRDHQQITREELLARYEARKAAGTL